MWVFRGYRYHDMGLIGCILPALLRPGPRINPPEVFLAKPSIWLRAISRFAPHFHRARFRLRTVYRPHS